MAPRGWVAAIDRIAYTNTCKRINNTCDAHAAVRKSSILHTHNDAILQILKVVSILYVVFRTLPGTEPPHRITHEDNALRASLVP
jgi:hypothetical protein